MVGIRRWDLLNTLFLTGTLALALVLVPWRLAVAGLTWTEALVFLAMTFAIGTAISGGYHRLFSHRAYRATWPVRFLFLCLGGAAFENSALKWSSDHRQPPPARGHGARTPTASAAGLLVRPLDLGDGGPAQPLAGVADLEKDPAGRVAAPEPLPHRGRGGHLSRFGSGWPRATSWATWSSAWSCGSW